MALVFQFKSLNVENTDIFNTSIIYSNILLPFFEVVVQALFTNL